MNAQEIVNVLAKSGYNAAVESGAVVVEDPTCIIRSLADFIDFAWIALGGITAVLLFGWGIARIRGSKIDVMETIKNMVLLFGGLTLVPTLVSILINNGMLACKRMQVSADDINRVLVMKDSKFSPAVIGRNGTIMHDGLVNGHPVVEIASVFPPEELDNFRRVAMQYGLRVRGCEAEGCGHIDASRIAPPYEHEGTDLYRDPGEHVPTMFDGTVVSHRDIYSGLKGLTIRNDNGTTTYTGYVVPTVGVGERVRAGQVVGISQDLTMHPDYAFVPNHTHYEIWTGDARRVGSAINIEGLF